MIYGKVNNIERSKKKRLKTRVIVVVLMLTCFTLGLMTGVKSNFIVYSDKFYYIIGFKAGYKFGLLSITQGALIKSIKKNERRKKIKLRFRYYYS